MSKLKSDEYGIEAIQRNDVLERGNIRRLQKKVDAAQAELREAQLKRQNRVMAQ